MVLTPVNAKTRAVGVFKSDLNVAAVGAEVLGFELEIGAAAPRARVVPGYAFRFARLRS